MNPLLASYPEQATILKDLEKRIYRLRKQKQFIMKTLQTVCRHKNLIHKTGRMNVNYTSNPNAPLYNDFIKITVHCKDCGKRLDE